jgi:hypothetical protein
MFADQMQERNQRAGRQYKPTPPIRSHNHQPTPLPTTRFPDRLPTPTPPRAQPTQMQIEKNRKLIQLKVQCRNDFKIAQQLRAEEDAKYQQLSRDYKLAQQIQRESY